jgi:YgiT-type zinc finger domain-containing protein
MTSPGTWSNIIKKGGKMKTCYMCKGIVELSIAEVEVGGVVVKDMPAEVCSRCNEKYFDTRTASFIQEVAGFVAEIKNISLINSKQLTK